MSTEIETHTRELSLKLKRKEYNRQHYLKRKEYYASYRTANKEKHKQWRQNNTEKLRINHAKYKKNNTEHVRNYHRKYIKTYNRERRRGDQNFKIKECLRTRLYKALKSQDTSKSISSMQLIGCTVEHLKNYLQQQWLPGMSWDNHARNGWHIDHIRPCNMFNLSDPEQQKICFHYTNLRPLWAKDNQTRPDDGSDITLTKYESC
jgi:hypothetical protein